MPRRIDHYLQSLVHEDKFEFYEVVRDFADAEVAPHVLKWERDHVLMPDEVIAQMGEIGLFGLPIKEEYGGQGGDMTDLVLMGQDIADYGGVFKITDGFVAEFGHQSVGRAF